MDLKRLRKTSGLSQWSAARRSGVPRMRLSLAETGQLTLKPDEETALYRVLHDEIEARQKQLEEAAV